MRQFFSEIGRLLRDVAQNATASDNNASRMQWMIDAAILRTGIPVLAGPGFGPDIRVAPLVTPLVSAVHDS